MLYLLRTLEVWIKKSEKRRDLKDRNSRILIIGALLGLVTYTVHGFLNDFLDSDKIATPFWCFIAFIVAMDIRYKLQKDEDLEKFES